MKLLKRILLVVLLVVVIGLVIVYFKLNSIVRYTVESQATTSLNLATTLKAANVSPFGGRVSLSGLDIASPPGFEAPHIVSLKEIAVAVNYSELTGDPIKVAEVNITGPRLVIEQNGLEMNIKAMMDRMPKAPEPKKDEKPAKPMRLVITKVNVTDATVVFHAGLPGIGNEIVIPLPTITLNNVGTGGDGKKEEGASMKDVIMQVVAAMTDAASHAQGVPDALKKVLNINVEQLGKDLAKNLSGIGGNLGGTVKELGKGLDSIFKKDEPKK